MSNSVENNNSSVFDSITNKFLNAISIFNKIDAEIFENIVQYVITFTLTLSTNKKNTVINSMPQNISNYFSSEEFIINTGISDSDSESISLIFEATRYILDQIVYKSNSIEDDTIYNSLVEAGLNTSHSTIFTNLYKQYHKKLIDFTTDHNMLFGTPFMLSSVDWRLNLGLGSKNIFKPDYTQKNDNINAIFDLNLYDSKASKSSKVTIEFNKEQLFEFYNSLEKVQQQLDKLQ